MVCPQYCLRLSRGRKGAWAHRGRWTDRWTECALSLGSCTVGEVLDAEERSGHLWLALPLPNLGSSGSSPATLEEWESENPAGLL